LTNLAFQYGLACEELSEADFAANDPYHPLVVGIRARKQPAPASATRARSSRGVVLLYHRVADVHDIHDLTIAPSTFAEQMAWLSHNSRVMPLEQLLHGSGDGLPERAVAISFDDGYLDMLQRAAPVLEREGLAATVFATTRWLEEPGEYWWDVLERALLQHATPSRLTIEVGGTPLSFSLETPDQRRIAHDTLHRYLVHASLETRDRMISEVRSWASLDADPRCRPLVADELQRLASVPGIAIGAHSVNHLALPDQSAAIQQREVRDSARDLERLLGTRVSTFAFPYGAVDRCSAETSRHQYRWSMTCDPAPVPSCFDTARVPRFEVKQWDNATFAAHMERLFAR
jgi:peptidoglycan/xylan/chitin deacetylase (PgdA/CDA1 family)